MTRFDYFIVIADMRTGSNFLEANLNQITGIACMGEAFNPAFVGYPKLDPLFGIPLEERDKDPDKLLQAIKDLPDLGGFRFFNSHDPRVLSTCLDDPRCAKIILTRNPLDSFVSLQIAKTTNQWKLTNATHSKSRQIAFDPDAFETYLDTVQTFQVGVLNALQKSGQTAFYIAYEDVQDIAVLNGLATFLGVPGRLEKLDKKLKRQNPQPLSDKVTNYDEMVAAIARLDRFNLTRTPNFEPRRGPAIPTYVAPAKTSLLYMPLRSGPEAAVSDWMTRLDDAPLQEKFTQKTLRGWMQDHVGFRSFTVLRHPVARAHAAFCDKILFDRPGAFPEVRANLCRVHKMPLPDLPVDDSYDPAAHKKAFLAFLQFIRRNLAGQTNVRLDPAWASQMAVLEGMSQFALPDQILREDTLAADLAALAGQVGATSVPDLGPTRHQDHDRLSEIYDAEIEAAARDAYQRDYLMFGFADWPESTGPK